MCRVLKVHRSGYYAWKVKPLSNRAIEDAALLVEIKRSYVRKATAFTAVHAFTMTYERLGLYVVRIVLLKLCEMLG